MRKSMLIAAGVMLFATSGLAVAHGFNDGKAVKSVSGTFTATTAGKSQTRTCTTTDGKSVTMTFATYTGTSTGTSTGDADLTGAATFQVRSTINTTDNVGMLSGKLKVAATGGDTVAHFDAVYDHGTVAGLAVGHGASHAGLLANLSGSFSATGGFTGGKLGGGTAPGSAVEVGPARCASTKTISEKSEAHGTVSAASATSITVGGLTCTVPSSLSAKTSALKLGDRAEIKCSLVSGVNTLTHLESKKS